MPGNRFLAIFDKNCVIFDKKVTYLLKISNFGTLKFMKTCPVVRFLGIFFAWVLGFLVNFAWPRFALAAHLYLPFLGSRAPSPSMVMDS